jgi:hypothetical protein
MHRTEQLVGSMRDRIAVIDDEKQRLEAALAALGERPKPGKAFQRRSVRSGATPGSPREALLALITEQPGIARDEIGEAVGARWSAMAVSQSLRQMREQKLVRVSDQGIWYPVGV